MEARLLRTEAMLGTDRTRLAHPASKFHAVVALGAPDMARAGADIELLGGVGADRARAETRLRGADVAGARPLEPFRKSETLRKNERAAIAVPEAPIRMNQHAERRGMQ